MGTLRDCTIHPTVPFPTAYRVHPISLYHGRDWTDWNCTKVSHFPPPTGFIPSHCTMGGTGQTGVVPKCPPFAVPCTYCPSRPIVQWEGLDGQRLYQSVCPVPTVHPIPLYHGIEWTDRGCTKVSPLLCPVPTVHPIPLYQIKIYWGSMPRDSPSFPHTLSTDTYLPPNNPSNLILPALGQKAGKKP